jgi:hypothetical protein
MYEGKEAWTIIRAPSARAERIARRVPANVVRAKSFQA